MLLKQASKRLFFLPSSAISTLLKRERGTSQPLVLGALPPALGSWAPTSGAEVPRRDGALVCREPCQKVPPPSMTWPSPEDSTWAGSCPSSHPCALMGMASGLCSPAQLLPGWLTALGDLSPLPSATLTPVPREWCS